MCRLGMNHQQHSFSLRGLLLLVGGVCVAIAISSSRFGPLAGFGFAAVYFFFLMEWRNKGQKGISTSVNLMVSLGATTVFAACYGGVATIWFKPSNGAEWMFSPLNAFLFCGTASFVTNLMLLIPCWAAIVVWKAISEDRKR